ncbi:MAG: hypothetical protein K0R71_1863 [Bacillales bacterium]|jgi:hypothetical protein|nr:hypothetical protein [Bacillales bacterium]
MRNSINNKTYKKAKKISILITLLFLIFGTATPNFVFATETTPGIQMSFGGENTTYQYVNPSLGININSNQQINSSSIITRLDGQLINSSFEYKVDIVPDYENEQDVYVTNYLAGTVIINPQNLKDGAHTLSVTAADTSGVPVTKDWNFNVSVKPVFSSPTPGHNQVTKVNNEFSVNVTDNDGINESSIALLLDGNLVPSAFNSSTGQISYHTENGISDGLHTIKVTLQDSSGNTSIFNSSFTICTKGPTMTFAKSGQTLSKIEDLLVNVSSPINLNNSEYTVKLNGQPIQADFKLSGRWEIDLYLMESFWVVEDPKTGFINIPLPNLADGTQTLEVTTKNELGIGTTQSWNFNINISPEFGTPTPGRDSATKDNTGFSLKITDNAAINSNSIVASLDGETIPVSFNSTSGIISYKVDPDCTCQCTGCDDTPISDGLHTVSITAEDMVGNKVNYSWSFAVVTKGPNLTFTGKDTTFSQIPELEVSASSLAVLNNSDYSFKLDGQPVNAEFSYDGYWDWDTWIQGDTRKGTITFNPINLNDGLHTLEVMAKDNLGNVTVKTWSFTIAMKPAFSSATPLSGSRISSSPGFSVVVNDNDGFQDSSSFAVKLNGIEVNAQYNQTSNILSYYPQGGLTSGENVVTVVATDKAGATADYTWNFVICTTGPDLNFQYENQILAQIPELVVQISSQAQLNGQEYSFKLDGQPVNAEFSYDGYWDWDTWIQGDTRKGTLTYIPMNLENGLHTLEVMAKDILGNTTLKTWNFTINM